MPFADLRLTPHYPAKSPLSDIIALVTPGSDSYITEKYADEIGSALNKWSDALTKSPTGLSAIAESLDESIEASTLAPESERPLRSGFGIETVNQQFKPDLARGRDRFIDHLRSWLASPLQIETAEFEIFSMEQIGSAPLAVRVDIRYDLVLDLSGARKEERVGSWRTEWFRDDSGTWKARKWEAKGRVDRFCHRPRIHRCYGARAGRNRILPTSTAPRRRLLAHRARRSNRHSTFTATTVSRSATSTMTDSTIYMSVNPPDCLIGYFATAVTAPLKM